MIRKLTFISCISILLYGCQPQKTVTLWEARHTILPVNNKIMVLGIINDANDSMRMEIEDGMVKKLQDLGYYAVSSLKEFGRKGLSDLSQEGAFIKLCDNGIDAVLTIALIDNLKQEEYKPDKFPRSTSYYYYNRIWNYQKMQADLSKTEQATGTLLLGEGILFDLRTLEPLCVIQTKPIEPNKENIPGYLYPILNKMKKEKVLTKQNTRQVKSF